ncbi:MAG TPA: restriction endonuclease [Candidatus Ornithocaccomicrobium faecavium]|uniref:Restriction endonuclease n=1 Tax=Candidatus Ornithocaccomicrobium faecavium TaxID=2840890 RepID=A0A9D1P702_9FIRM|nr:restriction endonuclease [Candidatus Ornithocaccomicrobium faecavium]
MKKAASIPNYAALIEATYVALKQLGGSGRNDEINKAVYSILNISDEVLDILHTGRTSFSEIDYRLAWARTLLKNYGAITNSARRVWTISSEFADIDAVDGAMVEKCRNISNHTAEKGAAEVLEPDSMDSDAPQDTETWRQRVFNILIHMDPYAFERLAQRVLRECGFTDVIVTKSSGDGGIDGYGKLKINGIISFNIAFQCKRYQGVVGSPEIRDFRGSLTKNIEKGVFITTGTFSKAAQEEAENPGKQQIDLINGEDFIDMLADYSIGLTEVKDYEIDEEFFAKI